VGSSNASGAGGSVGDGNGGGLGTAPFAEPFQPSTGGASGSGTSDAATSAVAKKVDKALVDVNTTLGYQSEEAAGTGIVLTSNGEILTNNHVINGATSIRVTDIGNGHTYAAAVVGYDQSDDVAVLQLQGASNLATADLGTSLTPQVNQKVVAIGNAGGVGGTPSTAAGQITALNQSITASDENDSSSENLTGLLQVNADVEPGDSGGPLVTQQGQVIGMDTAASAGFQFRSSGHEGYAIPIKHAMSIAGKISKGQGSDTVHIGSTAFLGVEVSSQPGQGGGNSADQPQGAVVAGIVPDSPAAGTNLSQNDVITGLNGTTVTSSQGLTKLLSHYHPNDTVKLTWDDISGQHHTTSVRLATGPAA
jgi:S1-C subfamily serine protease